MAPIGQKAAFPAKPTLTWRSVLTLLKEPSRKVVFQQGG